MKLLMISGDRSILQGKKSAFWYTLEELSTHFERVDVICPSGKMTTDPTSPSGLRGAGSGQLTVPFQNVFFHPSPRGLWYQPWWILQKGSELIASHHHDVMTVHEYPPFYNGIGAMWLSKSSGVPYALEIHHIVGVPVASSFSEWVGRILSQLYLPIDCRRASMVRTVNHSVQSLLIRWGVKLEYIRVVPSFYLDHEILKRDPSVEKKYDLVFSARIVANKGLFELISALSSLSDVTLLVIGEGPERERCVLHARKLGVSDRVTFAGWLSSQQEVVKAMQSGKIFVMNSRSEGGPRVALEAMALGLPVISTPVGVMPEVIRSGENGVLTTNVARHLVESIQLLLHDDQLREKIGKEAMKINDRFERKKLIGEYANFLKGIVRP
jgi:glycosyltransferase involved in cell wall biosynthesis